MTRELPTTWLAENRLAGKIIVRVGRRGEQLVAEFANVGQLTASAGGTCAQFVPLAGASGAAIEKLRATVVDAFVRHAQGKVTLHGGAVSLNSHAVAMIGASRAGKSTLTAALCRTPNVALIADDSVAIELSEVAGAAVEVVPTQRAARLLSDACSFLGFEAAPRGKTVVSVGVAAPGRAILAAVVGLVFDSGVTAPTMRRLRGREAFSVLFNAAFRFVMDDPAAQLREFDQLRTLAESCPVYELRRPRDPSLLPTGAGLIRELLTDRNTEPDRQ